MSAVMARMIAQKMVFALIKLDFSFASAKQDIKVTESHALIRMNAPWRLMIAMRMLFAQIHPDPGHAAARLDIEEMVSPARRLMNVLKISLKISLTVVIWHHVRIQSEVLNALVNLDYLVMEFLVKT